MYPIKVDKNDCFSIEDFDGFGLCHYPHEFLFGRNVENQNELEFVELRLKINTNNIFGKVNKNVLKHMLKFFIRELNELEFVEDDGNGC